MPARLPEPRERPLLTVAEVVELMPDGVGEKAVRAAIAAGQIPVQYVGRYVLIPTARLREQLGISPDMDEAAPDRAAVATTDEPHGGPHDDGRTTRPLRSA